MKKIFTGNQKNINKTAFLNWRTHKLTDISNMMVLAEGFLSSSIELTQSCLHNNKHKKADMLIFPILFNANHGIELYLKSLTWTLNRLLKTQYKIEGKHNIKQIFKTVKSKIKKLKGNEWLLSFRKENIELENYIDELFSLIGTTNAKGNMDFSRYPISDKYENHFYIDRLDNVEIDLENYLNVFRNILENLDSTTSYFYHQELMGEY